MAEIRLNKLIKQFNIGLDTLVDFLNSKGAGIVNPNPNMKVSDEYLPELHKKFGKDLELKEAAEKVDVKLTAPRSWTRPPAAPPTPARKRTSTSPSASP